MDEARRDREDTVSKRSRLSTYLFTGLAALLALAAAVLPAIAAAAAGN